MIHITGTGANNLPACAGIRITVNTGFTGMITLVDGFGVTQAIVTNPATGNTFSYYGIPANGSNYGTVTNSATGDTTVNILSRTIA